MNDFLNGMTSIRLYPKTTLGRIFIWIIGMNYLIGAAFLAFKGHIIAAGFIGSFGLIILILLLLNIANQYDEQ